MNNSIKTDLKKGKEPLKIIPVQKTKTEVGNKPVAQNQSSVSKNK